MSEDINVTVNGGPPSSHLHTLLECRDKVAKKNAKWKEVIDKIISMELALMLADTVDIYSNYEATLNKERNKSKIVPLRGIKNDNDTE